MGDTLVPFRARYSGLVDFSDPVQESETAADERDGLSWPERLPDRAQVGLVATLLVVHVAVVALGPHWLAGLAVVLGAPLFGQLVWSFGGAWRPALLWTGPLALWNALGLYVVDDPLGDLMLAGGSSFWFS